MLGVGSSLFVKAVLRISGWNEVQFAEVYRRHGDLGSAADDILQAHTTPSGIGLREIEDWFLALSNERRTDRKLQMLAGDAPPAFRGGNKISAENCYRRAADRHEGKPGRRGDRVRVQATSGTGRTRQHARGDIREVVQLAADGRLSSAGLQLFRPVSVMLANPAEDAAELVDSFPQGAIAEDKYDGIRAQVHKQDTRVEFYSRTLDPITEFPELGELFRRIPGDFILDGEIVAWREGRALPFNLLQPRLGRNQFDLFLSAAAPIVFIAFDILLSDGKILLEVPWNERRSHLNSLASRAGDTGLRLAHSDLLRDGRSIPGGISRSFPAWK